MIVCGPPANRRDSSVQQAWQSVVSLITHSLSVSQRPLSKPEMQRPSASDIFTQKMLLLKSTQSINEVFPAVRVVVLLWHLTASLSATGM